MKKKVCEYVADFLAQHASTPIYVLSGAGNIRITDAIHTHPDLEYICVHHEQAGVMAALTQTMSNLEKKIGVMTVTAGPGSTNAITGIANAYLDSIPFLMVAGQEKAEYFEPPSKLRGKGVQGLCVAEMVESICNYSVRLMDPTKVAYELEKCLYMAQHSRPGPVWIEIPQDIQSLEVDIEEMVHFKTKSEKKEIHQATIDKVIKLIDESERPLLWAGHGIRLSGELETFHKVLRKLEIPTLLAWKAIDYLSEDDPLYVGRAGVYGQRGANFALQNCDLLVSLGTRLALPQRGYNDSEFARVAKKVVVEIDGAELEKFKTEIDVSVEADVGDFLKAINQALASPSIPWHDKTGWRQRCQKWKKDYPVCLKEYSDTPKGEVNSYYFIDRLSEHLPDDALIVTDMGTSLTCTHAAIKLKVGQRMITSTGLGEMGYGLPGAIGACLGQNKKPTVFIGTEGSLMMNIQELQTVIHNNLPIKFFILNNNSYLTIKNTERALFNGRLSASSPATGVTFPNLSKIFQAFGITNTTVLDDARDIDAIIEKGLNSEGPFLCDVKMNPDQPLIPKMAVKVRSDGSVYSPPLEDLFPFLPREELKKNMIIPLLDE